MACSAGACSYPVDLSQFTEPARVARSDGIKPRRWLSAMVAMHERWRQRQALMELDDRMLADIGITRDEVRGEVGKPFWK